MTKKIAKTKEFFASIAVAFGMLFFLLNYLMLFFITYAFSPTVFWPLLFCAVFILTGWFGLNYHPFKAKTFGMLRILKNKELAKQLFKEREVLIGLINKF
jgi:amino acid transporter